MLRPAVIIFALWTLALTVAQAQDPVRKQALVIGNSKYVNVPSLANPGNDARDLGATLRTAGFDVTVRLDLDHRDMRLALRDFSRASANADISLIYFAGHGIEVNKTNYLIPVSAELLNDSDIDFEAIPLDSVLNVMAQARGIRIVLLDACRDNPFRRTFAQSQATRSIGRGLGRVDPVGGVIVGFAAREGTVALDGDGRNSPYAAALIRQLKRPGLELGRMFRLIRDDVLEATAGAQEPFTYGSLPGKDIYLTPGPEMAALPDPVQPAPGLPDDLIEDFAQADKLNTIARWRAFLEQHGASDNALVAIALDRLSDLEKAQAAQTRAAERRDWLVPKAGLKPYGALELTTQERQLVQESLGYLGLDTGGIDGQFGPRTLTAITAARYQSGLPPGDRVDAALLRTLPDPALIDAIQSTTARSYRPADLPAGLEPRLHTALTALKHRSLLFGYDQGHLYIAVLGGGGWTFANNLARKAGGHLAVISSAAENAFIYNLFARDPRFVTTYGGGHYHGPTFGLFQRDNSREPGGGWGWVTGEPMTYRNWSPGNPDNFRGRQKYGTFFVNDKNYRRGRKPSTWDDTSGLTTGFIIEIE